MKLTFILYVICICYSIYHKNIQNKKMLYIKYTVCVCSFVSTLQIKFIKIYVQSKNFKTFDIQKTILL